MNRFKLADDESSITCLQCGKMSYNKNDILFRYCANCRDFHDATRCDFCMTPDCTFVKDYKAIKRFRYDFAFLDKGLNVQDDGEWAACAECAEVISKQQWDELAERGAMGHILMFPENAGDQALIAQTKALYKEVFGENYEGLH